MYEDHHWFRIDRAWFKEDIVKLYGVGNQHLDPDFFLFQFLETVAVLLNTWLDMTHYNDVIMSVGASQITSPTIVYSTVYSGADQRKHQSPASLALVWGFHRWPVNSPHTGPVTWKGFHLMTSSWEICAFGLLHDSCLGSSRPFYRNRYLCTETTIFSY